MDILLAATHADPTTSVTTNQDKDTTQIRHFAKDARVTIFAKWNNVDTPVAHAEVSVRLIVYLECLFVAIVFT
jgi:hypothetical protein